VLLESVVTWKWEPMRRYRATFTAEHVNTLAAMVRRSYPRKVNVICVTDQADGIDRSVEVIPDFRDFVEVPSPHGGKNPSCYRRLRMFHPEIASVFGKRFVSIDLDMVLIGDVSSVWDRPEDFVAFGDTNPQPGSHYNGSMMLLTAGSRPQVWNTFDPQTSPEQSRRAGSWGSDQGFISYTLGGGEAKWGKKDGVYSYRNHLASDPYTLPDNAKVVSFHGALNPWSPEVQHLSWVAQHYKQDLAVAS